MCFLLTIFILVIRSESDRIWSNLAASGGIRENLNLNLNLNLAQILFRRPAGFHAQSRTSRAVKLEVRPGRSRGQFKNAAILNVLMEAYSAI